MEAGALQLRDGKPPSKGMAADGWAGEMGSKPQSRAAVALSAALLSLPSSVRSELDGAARSKASATSASGSAAPRLSLGCAMLGKSVGVGGNESVARARKRSSAPRGGHGARAVRAAR